MYFTLCRSLSFKRNCKDHLPIKGLDTNTPMKSSNLAIHRSCVGPTYEINGSDTNKQWVSPSHNNLHQVARVAILLQSNKSLLDAPRRYEAIKDTDASSLVVGAAAPGTSEGLLTNNSSRALLVVVHITGSVAKPVRGFDEHPPVRSEADKM